MKNDSIFAKEFDNNETKQKTKNTTFRFGKKNTANHPQPIIRGLRIVEPTDALLATLAIKDERLKEYQENKDYMDWDFQIIAGEVEVNGVVFSIYIVLPQNERIFTDEVLANSNLADEEKKKYKSNKRHVDLEKTIKLNLEYLSRLDREVLLAIKEDSDPSIIFKTSHKYDYYYAKEHRVGGYAQHIGDATGRGRNINFTSENGIPIVHEFGHLFDSAMDITSGSYSKPRWSELAHKYGTALERTTTGGCGLSGYDKDDYEAKTGEFFADLFSAYYTGDKAKEGTYMIEYLEQDALLELQTEIEKTISSYFFEQLYSDYMHMRGLVVSVIDEFADYDQELYYLGNLFLNSNNDLIFNNNGQIRFNAITYLEVFPLLKDFYILSREYLDNPTEENKNKIINHISTERKIFSRLDNKISDNITYPEVEEESISIENDKRLSEKNKREAIRKLFLLKNFLKLKGKSLPKEAEEEANREIDIINQQIDLLAIDGLTNIELKTILVTENTLFKKIKNYLKTPDIIERICSNLSKLIISVKEIIKKYPDRKDLIDYVFMAERLKELLSNEELFKNRRGTNFLIKECLLQCDEEVKEQLTKPPMLIGTRTYKLQDFFDRLEYSIAIDTSEQKVKPQTVLQ